ncbi:hypothetical protein Sjap_006687 [Stephania japonica]|uniref:Endonuclease/exonuclease/phosphatase domain-containing protein n=1 Tax=Stephania japonica TaxID=461633 RepID=A0AAP0PLA5_9MAGN
MKSEGAPDQTVSCYSQFSAMLTALGSKFRRLCSKLRWSVRRSSRPKIIIRRFGKSDLNRGQGKEEVSKHGHSSSNGQVRPIRVATFNAAMFSMAPAVPIVETYVGYGNGGGGNDGDEKLKLRHSMEFDVRAKFVHDRPKSILKQQSPLHPNSASEADDNLMKQQNFAKSKLRVSINLPDNEISLERSRQLSFREDDEKQRPLSKIASRHIKGKAPLRSISLSLPNSNTSFSTVDTDSLRSHKTVLEVLREVDADILALQDVKAEEEKGMKPLSDLAKALGMKYVFAESWAPEYGNAVLSKWPIKQWKVQKIFDDTDFRNVLKATIDVPQAGDVTFYCTHLDHLNENWRMKQVNAIIESSDVGPHILAGGLNTLDETDYSAERWKDIIKYYEEIGKPVPRAEVMRFLKGKHYVDAKDFTGECESVVIIAKGQNVQGTCKYGTRVDYILASPNSPYKFVPGSYSVVSSKGTSDHHIVKVDIIRGSDCDQENDVRRQRNMKKKKKQPKVIKITNPSSSKGLWKINS